MINAWISCYQKWYKQWTKLVTNSLPPSHSHCFLGGFLFCKIIPTFHFSCRLVVSIPFSSLQNSNTINHNLFELFQMKNYLRSVFIVCSYTIPFRCNFGKFLLFSSALVLRNGKPHHSFFLFSFQNWWQIFSPHKFNAVKMLFCPIHSHAHKENCMNRRWMRRVEKRMKTN